MGTRPYAKLAPSRPNRRLIAFGTWSLTTESASQPISLKHPPNPSHRWYVVFLSTFRSAIPLVSFVTDAVTQYAFAADVTTWAAAGTPPIPDPPPPPAPADALPPAPSRAPPA